LLRKAIAGALALRRKVKERWKSKMNGDGGWRSGEVEDLAMCGEVARRGRGGERRLTEDGTKRGGGSEAVF